MQVTKMMVSGTRGGLGRILLTAFMLLAIVPLSVVSYLAIHQAQRGARQVSNQHLNLAAESSALQVQAWLDAQRAHLLLLADTPAIQQAAHSGTWSDICSSFSRLRSPDFGLQAIAVIHRDKTIAYCPLMSSASTPAPSVSVPVVAVVTLVDETDASWQLVGYPDLQPLEAILAPLLADEGRQAYLLDQGGQVLACFSPPCESTRRDAAASLEGRVQSALGESVSDAPTTGVVMEVERWPVSVLLEQNQETVLTRQEELATMLIASTLAAALLTTVLAAVITRQLTSPIMDLAVSAVKIAGGDLSQIVEMRRQDEIGILGRAFNVMTAELRSLYEGLEQKVAQRTQQLTEANHQLRYQAMQLTLSAEIGRVATSILDLDELLDRVTQLVLDSHSHVYSATHVAIFMQDEFGEWLDLHTVKGYNPYPGEKRIAFGGENPIGQTALEKTSHVRCLAQSHCRQVIVPLRIGARTIGVLELLGNGGDGISQQDINALESLGDQISVAIENARVYAAEHEAVERLSRLDHVRLASLSAGSRELATALNNIIGFSRLMLKGVDGPITDLQRTDLTAIHKSGYHLLGLIDNVITLSELERGSVELDVQPIDVIDLVDDVLAMGRQRFIDVTFAWQNGRPLGIPQIQGDPALLRQALMGLVSVAVEQIPGGTVAVQTVVCGSERRLLVLSVGSAEWVERGARVCERLVGQDRDLDESSVSLALGEQIVALHNGKMWADYDMEFGWCGGVALPVHQVDDTEQGDQEPQSVQVSGA